MCRADLRELVALIDYQCAPCNSPNQRLCRFLKAAARYARCAELRSFVAPVLWQKITAHAVFYFFPCVLRWSALLVIASWMINVLLVSDNK